MMGRKQQTILPKGIPDQTLADNFARFFKDKVDKICAELEEQRRNLVIQTSQNDSNPTLICEKLFRFSSISLRPPFVCVQRPQCGKFHQLFCQEPSLRTLSPVIFLF